MRAAGDILLIACYELGHQPLAVAWPAAFLARAGYAPTVLDLAVEPLVVLQAFDRLGDEDRQRAAVQVHQPKAHHLAEFVHQSVFDPAKKPCCARMRNAFHHVARAIGQGCQPIAVIRHLQRIARLG